MKTRQKGFTLVEIAIVLVIIGLLLGGILKGQEMIVQAKIKNVIADFTGIAAAYHGYQDRYRAVPGDDPKADTRWTTPTAAVKGDGNGVIAGTYNSAACATTPGTTESCHWWDHLRRAGFIAGTGTNQPLNSTSGMIGVQTGNGATPPAAVLGGLFGTLICSSNLPDKIAIAADNQLDNGDARTGAVRAQLQNSGPNPAINPGADTNDYAETGTNFYTMCRAL